MGRTSGMVMLEYRRSASSSSARAPPESPWACLMRALQRHKRQGQSGNAAGSPSASLFSKYRSAASRSLRSRLSSLKPNHKLARPCGAGSPCAVASFSDFM